MKRLFIFLLFFFTVIATPSVVSAQGMMGGWTSSSSGIGSDNHTAQEEAEGKEIWDKLQAKQLECKNLTDGNSGSLGEYFMGQMMGSSHEAMNMMMERMMGKDGEEQMHVVMGKRMSGCDTSASYPSQGLGFMPMMGMMGSTGSPQVGGGGNPAPALSVYPERSRGGVEGMGYGGWNNMMGGFGIFGWLSMIIFWLLLILAVVALVKWLTTSGKTDSSKTPLEILKDRYARGEIDKKEFAQMKKELS